MAVEQLPAAVGRFAHYLTGLLARLDRGGGWYAVFWQRDPDGMRACLDGREVPPWDVVEALLRDLGARYAPATAAAERNRAQSLHTAALAAYDTRPGGRDALGDRLALMLREQRHAADRAAELSRRLAAAPTREAADALRRELAWTRDDQERATARVAELRGRLARVTRPTGAESWAEPSWSEHEHEHRGAAGRQQADGPAAAPTGPAGAGPAPGTPSPVAAAPSAASAPTPHTRKRKRGGARFAGMAEEGTAPLAVPVVPTAPEASGPPGPHEPPAPTPRGARFAGAGAAEPGGTGGEGPGAADRHAVAEAVRRLAYLRRTGRSGEAHGLLAEAAQWPAVRLPLFADALRDAGLGADWATLLWEAAALPADRLVDAADALAGAGREHDAEQMLRQGVVRPADEIGRGVLGLVDAGRHRAARVLLGAYVRVRTPEQAARSVAPDPPRLVPLLLEAALGVGDERHWDLVHALRVAGLAG